MLIFKSHFSQRKFEIENNMWYTTSLKQAEEPVMIYSSGVNDLMREEELILLE